jgi:hypothetical protein
VSTWVFHLRPLNGQATRLIVRSRGDWHPGLQATLMWDVMTDSASFIMGQKMLRGIKQRVEKAREG